MTYRQSFARENLGQNLTIGLFNQVGRGIVRGDYKNASFLTERQISERYTVSRATTRAAVKMLSAKGMICGCPRNGLAVQSTEHWNLFDSDVLRWIADSRSSQDFLNHLMQIRIAIEPAAASLAAKSADCNVKRIKDAFNLVNSANRGEVDFRFAIISFHISILRETFNPFFINIENIVSEWINISMKYKKFVSEYLDYLEYHYKIIRAIEDGKPFEASKHMREILMIEGTL